MQTKLNRNVFKGLTYLILWIGRCLSSAPKSRSTPFSHYVATVFLLLSTAVFSQVSADDLINGGSVSGSISSAGEQDSWTFNAVASERITLTVVDVNSTGLRPLMTLYAPDVILGNRITNFYQ